GAGGFGSPGGARLSGRRHPPAHRAEGNRPAADNVFLCTWGGVSGRTGGGDAGNTSMTAPFFVTATGTDSGKTHILCALLRAARERSLSPVALKPVHSGFADPAESDSARLLRAAGKEP